MLEFIDTANDVIAIRLGERISGADLDAVLDRVEPMLSRFDKVQVYVEVADLTSVEVQGLARYAMRAMPLMGKLSRFGRVAVVADQAWIRWGAKVESMVLPFVSYRTFELRQAAEALAWVEARAPSASG